MVEIKPFIGWHFDEKTVKDMKLVVAPPHDVISKWEQDELYSKSPYNVVKLILPKSGSPQEAKDALNALIDDKVIVRAEKPAYYIYEQEFTYGGTTLRRFGFLALIKVEKFGNGIFPHEMVFQDRVDERYEMISKTRADLSPVFGLFKDSNSEVREALWCSRDQSPLFDFKDSNGSVHRIWPVYDNSAIAAMFKEKKIIVADGHHRYTAASMLAERDASEDAKYTMIYLVGMDDPALMILPTHRLVTIPEFDLTAFLKKASVYFNIQEMKDVYELESVLVEADEHTFGMHTRDKSFLLELKDKSIIAKLVGIKHKHKLDVSVLQEFVIKRIMGAELHQVSYSKHPDEVKRLIEEETHDVAFLMRRPSVDDVSKVVDEGDIMPHKSTYFFPKPLAGVIIRLIG